MKVWVLLFATWLGVAALAADEVPVSFIHNDPNATTVEVAGEFSNWKTLPMAKEATGVWTKTLHLKPGSYGYKFVVNGDWRFDPVNPARKTVNDVENSAINVAGNAPLTNAQKPVAVQFQFTDATAKTVHVAGTFNRWLDNIDGKVVGQDEWRMQNDGTGKWTLTRQLFPGTFEFKYVVDGGARWEKDPKFPAKDDNSVLEVRAGESPAVSPPAAAPVEEGRGNASFTYAAPDAKSVAVAGDFNKWNAAANSLRKDAAGIWSTSLQLRPGKYQYKIVVDGNWLIDPTATDSVDDGYGGKNSVKIVP